MTADALVAALSIFGVIELSAWALEGIAAVFGLLTFFCSYLLLYKKDHDKRK